MISSTLGGVKVGMSTLIGPGKHGLTRFVRMLAVYLPAGCLLAACGSGNNDSVSLSDKNFVESANSVCTHYNMDRNVLSLSRGSRASNADSIRFLKEHAAELAKLQALVARLRRRSITVRYFADLADEERWIAMVRMDLEHRDVPYMRSFVNKLQGIKRSVDADERVLGLTACVIPGAQRAVTG